MAIKTKDELLQQINTMLGERTDDEALAIVEDFNDTLTDLQTKAADTTEWETKYNELDASWRNKYKERFLQPGDQEDPDEPEEEPEPLTFGNLFKTE